jgi:hypothetical protein
MASIEGRPMPLEMAVVASDSGLLPAPVPTGTLRMGVAERYEVITDRSPRSRIFPERRPQRLSLKAVDQSLFMDGSLRRSYAVTSCRKDYWPCCVLAVLSPSRSDQDGVFVLAPRLIVPGRWARLKSAELPRPSRLRVASQRRRSSAAELLRWPRTGPWFGGLGNNLQPMGGRAVCPETFHPFIC